MNALPSSYHAVYTPDAALPKNYERAKTAIAECERIDECKDWADKAAAIASYARQSVDDTLLKMATRIQLRAVRRCGELLQTIQPARNQRVNSASRGVPTSRAQAARNAGLSRDQKHTALRVASVPESEFEKAIESDDCPTVTEMAERGTRKKKHPLEDWAHEMVGDRNPEEFKAATHALGSLPEWSRWVQTVTPEAIIRGSHLRELPSIAEALSVLLPWLTRLSKCIDKELKK